jgi:hypothetical protein
MPIAGLLLQAGLVDSTWRDRRTGRRVKTLIRELGRHVNIQDTTPPETVIRLYVYLLFQPTLRAMHCELDRLARDPDRYV